MKVYDMHAQDVHCSLAVLKLNRNEREKNALLSGSACHKISQDWDRCIGANTTTTDHQRAAALHDEHAVHITKVDTTERTIDM